MSALSEREAYRLLADWPKVGPVNVEKLLRRFRSAVAVVRQLDARKGPLPPVSVNWVARSDPDYPPRLLHLDFPPLVLYYLGKVESLRPGPAAVAVIGTRRATSYSLEMARSLGRKLTDQGVQVVSGLARGIDAAAHLGCLESRSATPGRPLAVVGCGLDSCYPPEHRSLQRQIAERGAVLSEYPPGTPPSQFRFPERNRIIAALSHSVVVVEAPIKSGTLITARQALELGREVLAIPGRVGQPECAGSNSLIKDGAGIVTSLEDVVSSLGSLEARIFDGVYVDTECQDPRLLEMGLTPCYPDDLCQVLNLQIAEVQAWLIKSELDGTVVGRPDGSYQRRLPFPK